MSMVELSPREEYIRALGIYAGAMQVRERIRQALDDMVLELGDKAFETGERAMIDAALGDEK